MGGGEGISNMVSCGCRKYSPVTTSLLLVIDSLKLWNRETSCYATTRRI